MTIHQKRVYWIVVYTSGPLPTFLGVGGRSTPDMLAAARFETEKDALLERALVIGPATIACVHSDCTYVLTMPEGA